jgi:hypothetical protein
MGVSPIFLVDGVFASIYHFFFGRSILLATLGGTACICVVDGLWIKHFYLNLFCLIFNVWMLLLRV